MVVERKERELTFKRAEGVGNPAEFD